MEGTAEGIERADAVIVGGRCAGSAAAIALARSGRRAVVFDRAAFPSDTLSTHLFFPSHFAELARLGALDRVAEIDWPRHEQGGVHAAGTLVQGHYNPFDGIAYGACIRRPGLDLALVETAREAGAEVRERVAVIAVIRGPAGRVTGVRWRARDGERGETRAALVVGADGRRSSVAEMVVAPVHHRRPNGRMMAFAYYEDPREGERAVANQWRAERELGTIFPCDGGQLVALVMPPAERAAEFRADPLAAFEATVAAIPLMAARVEGCTRVTKVRTSYEHAAFFRRSSGPGWALAGDAGHFKDPVIAQGIRDALRFGRLLGEAAAPHLGEGDDPGRLDAALAAWEENRDTECLDSYQWANSFGRPDAVSPVEAAAYRWFAARDAAPQVLDGFSRGRRWGQVFSPARAARWAAAAWRDPATDRRELLRVVARDTGRELARARERLGFAHVRERRR